MSERLSKHVGVRKLALKRLTEILEIGNSARNDPQFRDNFLIRSNNLEKVYEDFQKAQNNIIGLIDETEFDDYDAERSEADLKYYSIKALIAQLTPQQSNEQNNALNTSQNNALNTSQITAPTQTFQLSQNTAPKLSKIHIPIFTGNIADWPAYYDLFKALVHENTAVSTIEKYHHLKTSLQSEPLNLIKGLPLTADNYEIAFNTLIKRYQNRRQLATSYYHALMESQSLTKPSPKELRNLLDTFQENVAALKKLNFPVKEWDFILLNTLLKKLDERTRTDFEIKHSESEVPSYDQLVEFLESQSRALDSAQLTVQNSSKFKQIEVISSPRNRRTSSFVTNTTTTVNQFTGSACVNCIACAGSHNLYKCPIFLSKSTNEKFNFAREKRLCKNCLSPRHKTTNCNSINRCRVCQKQHHTLLHLNTIPSSQATVQPGTSNESSAVLTNTVRENYQTVLLSTASIHVKDSSGRFQTVRAIIDSGSQANFITNECVQKLGLKRFHSALLIEGLNNMVSQCAKGTTHLSIKPRTRNDPVFNINAQIVPKICSDQPKMLLPRDSWNHLKYIDLADDRCHIPSKVDLLIGAELMPYIFLRNKIFGNENQPTAIESVFGWVLQGRTGIAKSSSLLVTQCTQLLSVEPSLDKRLQKFWEVDDITASPSPNANELKCESIFKETLKRDPSGRFIVSLPFRYAEPNFGDTFNIALRRFLLLESRLLKNPALQLKYIEFMNDYENSSHMSKIDPTESKASNAYYIPHHCVMQEKLRVVFDASAKGSSGFSLNDSLLIGPKLQTDIFSVLLKFRTFPVAFTCDIKQMYRQILLCPEHRQFQRIIWRASPHVPIQEYELNTVTYGVASSPFLALRTIRELAHINTDTYPDVSRVLTENIYVDDLATGAKTLEQALQLQRDIIKVLREGCFELGKWASNHPQMLASVSTSNIKLVSFDKDEPSFIKVLGIKWDPKSDSFSYSHTPQNSVLTKRSILSDISRIYDPLGFLAPCVLLVKHLLQTLWARKIGWDDDLSDDANSVWNRFKTEAHLLSSVNVPRYSTLNDVSRIELHAFCDASQIGYCASAYLRLISLSGVIKISFLCAKSRVAPLKTISVPRLELCACVLLSDLLTSVNNALSSHITIDETICWSDSRVALTWLASSPHRWKTFIANRVTHVQECLPNACWRYVPTAVNPADLGTRGLYPSELLLNSLWWQGPPWLLESPSKWPPPLHNASDPEASQEAKVSVLASVTTDSNIIDDLLKKFSSIRTVTHVVAYVLRFINRSKPKPCTISISPFESQQSLLVIVKIIQAFHFANLIEKIKKNVMLPKSFRKLAPFLDEAGLLRVGGRLRHSDLPFDSKHPVLLPNRHRVTELIVRSIHLENSHPGFNTLRYLISRQFWIPSSKSVIYRTLSECVRCFRCKPKSYTPLMADLPSIRVSEAKVFLNSTLDFAGPFAITLARLRGSKTLKAYVCIFVCCAVKAIHLELVSDLSSDAFIACLRRFVGRRGRCETLISDQGTNFVGANQQFKNIAEILQEKLKINWKFNPPASPHFNGLIEAGVKGVKTHLNRVIGNQILTYEEFNTVLVQIESLLNSRPLCPMSSDPNDLQPLTPGHFLILEPLNSTIPDPDLSHLPINKLSRWQLLQKINKDFWSRWKQEYLQCLQNRAKWNTPVQNIEKNALVVIKDEHKAALDWELARVVETHPGSDGLVRVATVKTAHGIFKRPVTKLCPLPHN